jgi:hypothetical protein
MSAIQLIIGAEGHVLSSVIQVEIDVWLLNSSVNVAFNIFCQSFGVRLTFKPRLQELEVTQLGREVRSEVVKA